MPYRLLNSTAFRTSVLLGITLACASLVASLVAYVVVTHELERRMDQSIRDTFAVISAAYGDNDQTDLIDAVTSHQAASLGHTQIYGLMTASGEQLAGDAHLSDGRPGWQTLGGAALGLTGDDSESFRVFTGAAGPNLLIVGSSYSQARQLGQLSALTLALASLVTFVLVVGAGSIIALRAQRRIDAIANTMQQVGRGDLTARIPLGSAGDDIDHLARQVNDALDRLAALVDGMRQVSVNIAHDLKTPLNRLAIGIEAAIIADESGGGVKNALQEIEAEARQIGSTFDALLRIAQIEAGARRSRFQRLSLAPILRRLFDIYADVADDRGQQFALAVADDLPDIDGDGELLMQLFANLIENAIRHCPTGVLIEIGAARTDDLLSVTCRDTGPGIPLEARDKVFDRLYRLEMSRTTPGNGLGLSMVRAIADLHGASVQLTSGEPGLVVTVSFPVPAP